TGQFSLGHGGFMAVGADTAAGVGGEPGFFVPQVSFWDLHPGLSVPPGVACLSGTSMGVSGAGASVRGLPGGMPTLRLRGDYLAIATLGFGEIIGTLITNSEYLERTFGLRIDSMRQKWFSGVLASDLPESDPMRAMAVAVRTFNTSDNFLSAFW